MGFLNNLFGGGSGKPKGESEADALWLYVQCNKCGSPLAVRIDRRNEVTPDYEGGGAVLRKEMMDSKCFQLMYAELHFDSQGKVTEQSIERGKFLTRAEYDALKSQAVTR